jgi:hypothetical protein
MSGIREGDRVRCRQGNIDKNLGAGLIGVAGGFARFSSYHAREVMVRFGNGEPHPADGWFWLTTVELAAQPFNPDDTTVSYND